MKVLFKISSNTSQGVYQHGIVCLAEGFSQIGVEYYGNIDYWYIEEEQTFLIQACHQDYKPDVVIYSSHFVRENFNEEKQALSSLFSVLVDNEDGLKTCSDLYAGFFDIVLRSHYNSHHKYEDNVYPWAFGLSERMIKSFNQDYNNQVQERVFTNYRVFYNGRFLAKKFMDPMLKLKFELFNKVTDPYESESDKIKNFDDFRKSYWWQTGCRHDREYFSLLNDSRLTYSFGGPIILNISWLQKSNLWLKLNRNLSQLFLRNKLLRSKSFVNYQFDSWRFWEAMLSRSIPLHFDFDSWNFVLPVMPVNGIHYFGVKELDFEGCAERILKSSTSDLNEISTNGTSWVLEHYSSSAVSKRLLKIVSEMGYAN